MIAERRDLYRVTIGAERRAMWLSRQDADEYRQAGCKVRRLPNPIYDLTLLEIRRTAHQ